MIHGTWQPDALQRKIPLSEPFKLQVGARPPGPDRNGPLVLAAAKAPWSWLQRPPGSGLAERLNP
jgi:hypothetical protein